MTDVTIAEDDERVDRAFHYVSQNLLTKAKKNTINSSESAKKQVNLTFVAVFLMLR